MTQRAGAPGVLASFVLLAAACSPERAHRTVVEAGTDASAGDAGAALDERAAALVAQMSLDEKLAQLSGTGNDGGLWRTPGLPRLGVRGYAMTDGPRGVTATNLSTQRSEHATAFPVAMARAATFDVDLETKIGDAIGEEARAWGANVILAPVVNLLTHPAWGRAQETYGEDTLLLSAMGAAFVRGAQQHVLASVKHFAVNDIENTRYTVDVTVDERTLREVYLPPFRAAIDAGALSVMTAYNQVNGRYCSENAHLLTDILKTDWAFRGFVESDWVFAVQSTAPSLNAGLDLEMPAPNYYAPEKITAALDAGEVPPGAIDDAVTRLVRTELAFEERAGADAPALSVVGNDVHAALALSAARESMVLLKNDQQLLPLDRARIERVAVVGTFAGIGRLGDVGSSLVLPGHYVTPLDGLRHRAPGIQFDVVDADALADADREAVRAADAAIVVVGLSAADEGENTNLNGKPGDRLSLSLSPEHEALVSAVAAANARTVVVVEAGSAITMEAWHDAPSAILLSWYPGQEGGDAIADVLFGDAEPGGRLPISIPVAASQLPPFDATSTAVTHGYFSGYRYLDHAGETPLFPFGFGLGYTTFALANLSVSGVGDSAAPEIGVDVTVDVTNTGARDGDEVVQLYAGYPSSKVERSVRDLKAFRRVHVSAGATTTVTLPLRPADLAYYDVARRAWVTEALDYSVSVGSSSRDLPLEATFHVR